MNHLKTTGIILSRTDYGEADRIITLLTPDYGKLRLMAKGVRRVKSKLAGGIELFSTSQLTFIQGRGEIGTLVSTRLIRHYGHIVSDITRVQLGYDLIKQLNTATADEPGKEYYELLEQAFQALDDAAVAGELIRTWFAAQLLRLDGLAPNLSSDTGGAKLDSGKRYQFLPEENTLRESIDGSVGVDQIKFLRLLFSPNQPKTLQQVQGIGDLLVETSPIVARLFRQNVAG